MLAAVVLAFSLSSITVSKADNVGEGNIDCIIDVVETKSGERTEGWHLAGSPSFRYVVLYTGVARSSGFNPVPSENPIALKSLTFPGSS